MYDQSNMCENLIACFRQRKITTIPLFEKRNTDVLLHIQEHLHHRTDPDNQLD